MILNKSKQGISLIVLVITIVVMIILAATIILTLSGSDIKGKATEAVNRSDVASAKEVVAMVRGKWELDEDELKAEGYENFGEYATDKLKEAGYKTTGEGSIEVVGNGTIYVYPKIPEGFVASNISTEDQVSEGLVIYEGKASVKDDTDAQTTRNQFVWVPVNNISEFKRVNWTNDSTFGTYYTEPSSYQGSTAYQYSTEVAEYNAMRASVEKYGGFYIARYEAGDGDVSSKRTTYTAEVHTVVSKKGAYIYNYVGWGNDMADITSDVVYGNTNRGKGAVYLSQTMYPGNNNYTTNLIYGVQWDATLRWLSDEYNVLDSRSWGNCGNSTGEAAINSGEDNMNYTTGRSEAWKAKNIYDLAGNVYEWTMEAYSTGCRVHRGGFFFHNGQNYPASYRNISFSPYDASANLGFRPTLYIN